MPKISPTGYAPVQHLFLSTRNRTGYTGVSESFNFSYSKRSDTVDTFKMKFIAKIQTGGVQRQLGKYDTAKEAVIAYARASLKFDKSTALVSGYFGVYKNSKNRTKYQAQIRIGGKCGKIIVIGSSYDTAEQAAKAYDKEAIKLCKPFSVLNYPKKAPVGYIHTMKYIILNKLIQSSTNSVGYMGVSKSGKRFRARTTIGGKKTEIGSYETAKEAAIAWALAYYNFDKSINFDTFDTDYPVPIKVEDPEAEVEINETNTNTQEQPIKIDPEAEIHLVAPTHSF